MGSRISEEDRELLNSYLLGGRQGLNTRGAVEAPAMEPSVFKFDEEERKKKEWEEKFKKENPKRWKELYDPEKGTVNQIYTDEMQELDKKRERDQLLKGEHPKFKHEGGGELWRKKETDPLESKIEEDFAPNEEGRPIQGFPKNPNPQFNPNGTEKKMEDKPPPGQKYPWEGSEEEPQKFTREIYDLAMDTKDIDKARKEAKDTKFRNAMIRGVADMFSAQNAGRGFDTRTNPDTWDALDANADAEVEQISDDKKDRLDRMVAGHDMYWKDKEGQNKSTKWKLENDENSMKLQDFKDSMRPDTDITRHARALAKQIGMPQEFQQATAYEIYKHKPDFFEKYRADQSAKTQRMVAEDNNRTRAQIDAHRREDKVEERETKKQEKAEAAAKLNDKQGDAINDIDKAVSDLDNILAKVEGNSGWVGKVDGNIPEMFVSSDQSAFRSAVGMYQDAYRKAITGAGASAFEIATLMKRLPNATDTYDDFKAKANEARNQLQRHRKIYLENLTKRGKNVGEYETGTESGGETGGGKTVTKKFQNKKTNQTKFIYSDGSEEVVDGLK